MAIAPYFRTTDLFRSLFDDLDDFMTPRWGGRLGGADVLRAPAADVMENSDAIRVTLELPGMTAEDIEVNLENNLLTVSGEKQEERTESDRNTRWHVSERRFGRFSRSFVLPREVDHDAIEAHFENGVLELRIPKAEEARPHRIEITGGKKGRKRIMSGN
ncbi:MAG: Hsp20/alpha crystallin family protein [Gemmatimonadota bacterium]